MMLLTNLIIDIQIYLITKYLVIKDLILLDIALSGDDKNQLLLIYPKIYCNSFEANNTNYYIYDKCFKWIIHRNIRYDIANIDRYASNINYIIANPLMITKFTLNYPVLIPNNEMYFYNKNNAINYIIANCINIYSITIANGCDLLINKIINNYDNIYKISLSFIMNNNSLNNLINKYQNVTHIILKYCILTCDINLSKCSKLIYLKLISTNYLSINLPTNLIKISINCTKFSSYNQLSFNIIILTLHNNINNLFFTTKFYKLEELYINHLTISSTDINNIISNCLMLKKIHFTECSILSDYSICKFNINYSIINLEFNKISCLSNKILKNFISQCPNLLKIKIDVQPQKYKKYFTLRGIGYIFKCNVLQKLELNFKLSSKLLILLKKINKQNNNLTIYLNDDILNI